VIVSPDRCSVLPVTVAPTPRVSGKAPFPYGDSAQPNPNIVMHNAPEQLLSWLFTVGNCMVSNHPKNAIKSRVDPASDRTMTGFVTHGLGDARHFIPLPGYLEQFKEKLGYEPFAGTLNIELTGESIPDREGIPSSNAIKIEGWQDGDQTYGPASCYPSVIEASGGSYSNVHVIEPERSRHDENVIELIAPVKLRDELPCDDGEYVSLHVPK
jgi:CTP-dependent riboflavin kinase